MQYGLNNNLGSANNVNRTQNSSFSTKKCSDSKGVIDLAGALDGVKQGKTGYDRLMSIVGLIKGGKALFKE